MELIVKIRQHTPIIHFQWDQTGATLRATELKPKLDKFLKEKNDLSIEKYFGQKGNLPYKVRIELGECTEEVYDGPFPTFFGNIKAEKKKKFVFYNGITTIRFFSFNKEVLDTISKYITEFFFKTNFGTRQSKGFGSFYIDPSDSSCYKNPSEFPNYYFTLDARETDFYKKYKKLFGDIDLFYRTLRSGINIKGLTPFYFKSIMFLYAKSKNWTWDKKAIKSRFVSAKELENQSKKYGNPDVLTFSDSNEYLVRDLLGVASSQAYEFYHFNLQYDKKNEIERFKSPITFKPVLSDDRDNAKFTVYLILNPIPNGIFGKEFKINKIGGQSANPITLKTPPLTEERFNIEEYLRFALNVDIDRNVDSESQKNWRFKIIKNIYSQLKIQLKESRRR